jgi:hypothetical protein
LILKVLFNTLQGPQKHTPMTTTNDSSQPASLLKRMLIGGTIGLMLISIFILPTEGRAAWGPLWMVRPLIITPLAGAMGGLCNYFIMNFREQFRLNKTVAFIVSMLVCLIGLWMGIVLGLDGTLWN